MTDGDGVYTNGSNTGLSGQAKLKLYFTSRV
jgi:hypothetical protein